jgi:hypothetical protein
VRLLATIVILLLLLSQSKSIAIPVVVLSKTQYTGKSKPKQVTKPSCPSPKSSLKIDKKANVKEKAQQ